ncbi:hypothetical protein PR202_ga27159 [Eleusine coracana subsp. coracana]|uniref:Uncharacterized protein n=1 Tax=Eleusine coracana subsp. coracana TaxID=191504 RepID=A0AAV5DGE9_ELECO|nr:hypothetical protein PR202_ga27159 [Eleusine coracana subsp. coracana]
METLPSDGRSVGEVMLRGNTVMSGYYKDAGATEEAMRTGGLGVRHPDGYVQLKDIIISAPSRWSPCCSGTRLCSTPRSSTGARRRARSSRSRTGRRLPRMRSSSRLPRYMAPRTLVFGDLPKTSTGKTHKYLLREKARAMGSLLHKQGTSRM